MKKLLFILSLSLVFAGTSVFIHAKPSQAQTPPPSCLHLSYNMQVGSTDATTNGEVSLLQNFLTVNGYAPIPIQGGYFGSNTKAAVIRFQIAYAIYPAGGPPASGYVGPITRQKIQEVSCGSAPSALRVLSPNGGEILQTGNTYDIRWNANAIPANESVKIELGYFHNDPTYPAGQHFEGWIIEQTPNTGLYRWRIHENYATGVNPNSFYIKLTSTSGMTDRSDTNFTINPGPLNPNLTVSLPAPGTTQVVGERVNVRWSPFDQNQSVGITLLKRNNTSFARLILTAGFSNGSWNFLIPNVPAAEDYYLKIVTADDAILAGIGYSGNFTVTPGETFPIGPFISITGTSGGQSSYSSLTINQGSTIVISGIPTNLNVTGNDFTRAFFFDPIFNGSCSNNSANEPTWTMTCTASNIGTGRFYIEIYRNGQTYRSNVVTVNVVAGRGPSITSITPTQGAVNSTVYLNYQNFHPSTGHVLFGGVDISYSIPSNSARNELTFQVPATSSGASYLGSYPVVIYDASGRSNPVSFTVQSSQTDPAYYPPSTTPSKSSSPSPSSTKSSQAISILQAITNLISANANYMVGSVQAALINLFDQLQAVNGRQ